MDIKAANHTSSLASKSITAIKWNYLGRPISLSLQFAIGIVLDRLLGPKPFGFVAIALFAENALRKNEIQNQSICINNTDFFALFLICQK